MSTPAKLRAAAMQSSGVIGSPNATLDMMIVIAGAMKKVAVAVPSGSILIDVKKKSEAQGVKDTAIDQGFPVFRGNIRYQVLDIKEAEHADGGKKCQHEASH